MKRMRASLFLAAVLVATVIPTGSVAASEKAPSVGAPITVLQGSYGRCVWSVYIYGNGVQINGFHSTAVQSRLSATNCKGAALTLGYAWQTSYGWQAGDFMEWNITVTTNNTDRSDNPEWKECPTPGYRFEGAVAIKPPGSSQVFYSRSTYYVTC